MLEDLIIAAVNDAKKKVDAEVQSRVGALTSGIPLPPGFKLPF
jgi:DNA-binding protein YbaB